MFSQEIEKLSTDWKHILTEILKEFPDLEKQISNKDFPLQNHIFNSFDKFNFKDLKIIIIGHDIKGNCFSPEDSIKMYNDIAEQGVLMLNNTLEDTYLKNWNMFSKRIIDYICAKSAYKVFIMFGNNSEKLKEYVTGDHYVLEANHLGEKKGDWWESKHFSQCNEILFELGDEQIEWIKK